MHLLAGRYLIVIFAFKTDSRLLFKMPFNLNKMKLLLNFHGNRKIIMEKYDNSHWNRYGICSDFCSFDQESKG